IDDKDVNYPIYKGPAIIDRLKKDNNVRAVSGRIITTGMISSSSTASGVEIHGIVPADEKAVSSISQDMVEGAYFTGAKKNEIVIGKKLSEKLGVKLHNKIVLTFQSKTGALTAGSLRIAGIFRSRDSSFDETTVFTRFDDLAGILGTGNDIHEIAVILKDGQKVEQVTKMYQKEYPSLLVQTWK